MYTGMQRELLICSIWKYKKNNYATSTYRISVVEEMNRLISSFVVRYIRPDIGIGLICRWRELVGRKNKWIFSCLFLIIAKGYGAGIL